MTQNEIHIVKEIARGLHTVWKVKKPSKVQKFLNALDGKGKLSKNDKRMELDTPSTRILVTTYRSKVTMHKITMKDTGESTSLSKTIDIQDVMGKEEFANQFADNWESSVSELRSEGKTQVAR
jgi:hypothetical protein